MKLSRRIITWILVLALILSAAAIPVSAAGPIMYGIGFTTGSGLRLRSEASTGSRIIDSANRNEVVVVLDKAGDWYKVIYDLQEGYMHGDYLRVSTAENAELGYGRVNGSGVNFRSGPDASSAVVATGNSGDKAYIIGINNGWYKVIFGQHVCYVRSDYLDLTEKPYENKASSKSPKFFRGGKSNRGANDALPQNLFPTSCFGRRAIHALRGRRDGSPFRPAEPGLRVRPLPGPPPRSLLRRFSPPETSAPADRLLSGWPRWSR